MSAKSPSLLPLLAPEKGKLILSVGLSIAATAMGLVPFVCIYAIANALLNPPVERSEIWQLVVVSFAAIVMRWGLLGLADTLSHIAAYNILYDLRLKLSQKFGSLPLGYFNSRSTGMLKKVMNEDVEHLELIVAHGIPQGIGLLTTVIVTAIYLFTVDWRMAIASLSGIPIIFLSLFLMLRRIQTLVSAYYAAQDRMNATIIEYVQGMAVIKAFTQTAESFTKYKDSVRAYHQLEEDRTNQSMFPWTLFTMSVTANLLVILPLGVWLMNIGSLSVSTFILFLLLGLGLCAPLVKLIESSDIYAQTQAGLDRIFAILNEPALPQSENTQIPDDLTIEFRDVHFSYQDKAVLRGISVILPPNSVTALVGPSGSGKTTIIRLIARFWDVSSGEICLGGIEIKNLNPEALAEQIAFVFQDVVLFNNTIYDNIHMGKPEATSNEIVAAAKAARCHDFIEALPNGYQTIIGERGAKLSGGQQQRISIARAILKDAPIVILDEATAFMDPENEAQIQNAIETLVQGKTLLLIAHRLSTITEADQIVVLNDGEIAGIGQHHELLQANSLYRQMWEAHVAAQHWTFAEEEAITR